MCKFLNVFSTYPTYSNLFIYVFTENPNQLNQRSINQLIKYFYIAPFHEFKGAFQNDTNTRNYTHIYALIQHCVGLHWAGVELTTLRIVSQHLTTSTNPTHNYKVLLLQNLLHNND